MTNKVKPFYIRITDDMTPQIALEVKDKCTNKNVSGDLHFNPSDIKRWKYLGVCSQDGLCYSDLTEGFCGNAQEITLNQLDEWLGLEVEEEWVNGDECIKDGAKYIYVSKHPLRDSYSICVHLENGLTYSLFTDELSKPETPEQKAERERLEAVEEITGFLNRLSPHCKEKMEYVARAIVDKTNYRKQ